MSESLNSPNLFELKLEVQKFVHGFLSENTVFKRGEVKNTEVENTEVENTVFKRGEVNCFQDFGDVLPFPAIY